jgi:hypothetical protein
MISAAQTAVSMVSIEAELDEAESDLALMESSKA